MFVTAHQQAIILFLSALCGICVGLFYDFFKILRRLSKPSVTVANIQDGIFWIVTATGVFVFLLLVDDGRIRFYQLCSIFAMWLVYEVTLSRFVVWAGLFIIKKLTLIILFPIRLICKLIKRPVIVAITISRKSFKRTEKFFVRVGRRWYYSVKKFKKISKKV